MVPYSKAHSKGKSTKTDKTNKKLNHLSFKTNSNINVRTEELLEKIMLAKTKHKKLWKFY
jgi:hypothetical protein